MLLVMFKLFICDQNIINLNRKNNFFTKKKKVKATTLSQSSQNRESSALNFDGKLFYWFEKRNQQEDCKQSLDKLSLQFRYLSN